MMALLQGSKAALPGLGSLRPIASLLDALPSLLQRHFATHGVSDSPPSREGGVVRFYKAVNVQPAEQGGYQVLLDHRVLKTPARRPLVVPSQALALAIAAEWEWQAKRVQPFTMPLMSLAATAIDQPKDREAVIEAMLQYLHTDPVCCRHEPGKLADRQHKMYSPIVVWAERELGIELHITDSIFGAELSDAAVEGVRGFLQGLDDWHLAAAEQLASSCKSVLLALATLQGELTLEQSLAAARLEEEHQIEEWGLVEGGHDIDIADLRVRVAAPSLFVRLLALRCAYTTALVRGGRSVADWGLHMERLARSIRAVHTALNGLYAAYYSWLEGQPEAAEHAALSQVVEPTVGECLRALRTAGTGCSVAGEEAMLVLALTPAAPRAAHTGEGATDVRPLAVHAFAAPYQQPGLEGVHADVVLGVPRAIPEAKDSSWVVERAPFERLRRPGAAEVLLCTADGRMLEGLVTNFFVVKKVDAGAGGGSVVVQTAPAAGVVWGSMRQRVLQACHDLGVAVREESPSVLDRQAWREAFLTNSLRIVQPLRRLTCSAEGDSGWEAWQLELPASELPGSLALRLREHVLAGTEWRDFQ